MFISAPPHQTRFDERSFYSGDFWEGGGRALVSARALLDYVGYRLTLCNVSQMTLQGFGLSKCNVSPARTPAHRLNYTRRSSAMLCSSMISSPIRRWPGRTRGPFGLESIIDLDIPPGTNAKRPSYKAGKGSSFKKRGLILIWHSHYVTEKCLMVS